MKIWAVEVSSASRECTAAVCSVLTNRTRHRRAVLESECTQATADTHASSMYTHVTARVHTHTHKHYTHPGRTQAPLGRRRGRRCQEGTYMYKYAHIRAHTSRSQTHDFHTHAYPTGIRSPLLRSLATTVNDLTLYSLNRTHTVHTPQQTVGPDARALQQKAVPAKKKAAPSKVGSRS